MATIASLLKIPNNFFFYEFMVEQLFTPACDDPNYQVISHLTEAYTSIYEKIYDYLRDNILPLDLYWKKKWNSFTKLLSIPLLWMYFIDEVLIELIYDFWNVMRLKFPYKKFMKVFLALIQVVLCLLRNSSIWGIFGWTSMSPITCQEILEVKNA